MASPGPISVRDTAVQIVRTLREAGHVAYFAGGCVRDTLLGLTPQDYDVATDAPPDAVGRLFRNARFVGEAFGVVLVRLNRHEFEVATFRAEWGYDDGRRPSHVEFTDARNDALRRDFTVNGLFEDPFLPGDSPAERVIDFVGGREDLQRRVLRAIGRPDERFAEDFLRMLRAPRFAARLGFAIDPETAQAIRQHAPALARISRERIGQEVAIMLSAPTRAQAAALIQDLELDAPTLNEPHLGAALPTLAALPPDAPLPLALAAWMLDRHVAEIADCGLRIADVTEHPPSLPHPQSAPGAGTQSDILLPIIQRWRAALCLSNEDRDRLQSTLALLSRTLNWSELDTAGRKRLLAEAAWPHTLSLLRAWAHRAGVQSILDTLESQIPTLLASGIAPEPWVTGDDLIAMGQRPGPRFKRLLDAAYDRQLDGTFPHRQAALDWLAEQRWLRRALAYRGQVGSWMSLNT